MSQLAMGHDLTVIIEHHAAIPTLHGCKLQQKKRLLFFSRVGRCMQAHTNAYTGIVLCLSKVGLANEWLASNGIDHSRMYCIFATKCTFGPQMEVKVNTAF